MAMTYHELVKKVQTALAKADASKVEEHIAVQVNVTGEAEGAFYMEIAGGVLYVAPYDYNDRDALLTVDGDDMLAIAQGKVTLADAIAEGKVGIEGNYDKAVVLGATIPEKKAAAKKTAAKKEDLPVAEAPVEAEAGKPKRGRKKAVVETAADEAAPAEAAPVEEKPAAKKTTAKKTTARKTKKSTK